MDHRDPGPAPQVDLEPGGFVVLTGPVVVGPPIEVVGEGVGEAVTGVVGGAPPILPIQFRTHCAPIC